MKSTLSNFLNCPKVPEKIEFRRATAVRTETHPLHVPIFEAIRASRKIEVQEKDSNADGGRDRTNDLILGRMNLLPGHSPERRPRPSTYKS